MMEKQLKFVDFINDARIDDDIGQIEQFFNDPFMPDPDEAPPDPEAAAKDT